MNNTKYPFMVEFTGSTEAGKTTCINTILERFSNCGLKVKCIQESAEIVSGSNIPKDSFEYHLSMRLLTLYNIINAKYDDYDLLLIDRGLLDGILYTIKFFVDSPSTYDKCFRLIDLFDSLKSSILPDLLVVFKTEPEVSIKRKGCVGHLVNIPSLKVYNNLLDSFVAELSCHSFLIDTSYLSKEEVSSTVFDEITKNFKKARP